MSAAFLYFFKKINFDFQEAMQRNWIKKRWP